MCMGTGHKKDYKDLDKFMKKMGKRRENNILIYHVLMVNSWIVNYIKNIKQK